MINLLSADYYTISHMSLLNTLGIFLTIWLSFSDELLRSCYDKRNSSSALRDVRNEPFRYLNLTMILHSQQRYTRMGGKFRIPSYIRGLSSLRLRQAPPTIMNATQIWRAMAHSSHWQAIQSLFSVIPKNGYSTKSAAKIDTTAKIDNLPLAGIKVLDLTRVLAGVITELSINYK